MDCNILRSSRITMGNVGLSLPSYRVLLTRLTEIDKADTLS